MTGQNEYELSSRFAVVKRPDEQGDVVGKFDQQGGGTIWIGRESDEVGVDIVVIESDQRSHVSETAVGKDEEWFDPS